jgi:hypothetical protein
MTARPLFLVLALAACAPDADRPATGTPAVEVTVAPGEVPVPAGPEASAPRLALGPDGRPLLSWTEPEGDGDALRYAVWDDNGWGAAQTADAGDDWFVNWADTPGVVPLPDGRLLAHTLTMHPEGDSPYAYDVRVRQRVGGAWSAPVLVHDDGVPAEHGFVSVAPVPGGRAGLLWLDGRETGGGHHGGPMTLRFAALGADGARSGEAVLDRRVCDCCPTALAATASGLVAAYRDRTAAEVRDVAVVRYADGAWTEPRVVHADGWEIAGCPVNGPALAAAGDRVALAWFTGAEGRPRVRLATSDDGGETFGPPVQIDGGAPVGRVGVALLPDGAPVVSWLEGEGEAAEVRVRAVRDGVPGEPVVAATVPAGRASGIPRVLAVGDRVLVAWTDPGAPVPVRTTAVAP